MIGQQQMIAVLLSVCCTGKLRLLRNIFSVPGNRQQVARAGPLHSNDQEKKKRTIANYLFHPVAAKDDPEVASVGPGSLGDGSEDGCELCRSGGAAGV